MRAELLDNPHARSPKALRFTGELREAYRQGGSDLSDSATQALIERGLFPIRGGATGMDGAAFMHNLPPEGSFIMDSDLFFQQTERNDVPQSSTPYPGFGGTNIDKQISNVGVLAGIQLIVEGTLKVSGVGEGGTVTSTSQWPWNLMSGFSLSANGQTSLLSAQGMDIRARRQRVYRNPTDPISVAPAMDATGDPEAKAITNGEYPVFLVYDIPIIHDWFTLTGALFAQSDQIYLSWHFVPPALADLFTLTGEGKAEFINGTVRSTNTFFDVPFADTQKGRKVLVPDLQWLHGFVGSDQFFSNQGEVPSPLIRTSGELLAYYARIANGPAATIDPTALSAIRFEYGGNRKPRVHEPPQTLLAKNVADYNGRLLPKAGYFVFDFEADNPSRDLVFPKGVTELKTVVVIPTGVEVKANARIHFVEEALFAGR